MLAIVEPKIRRTAFRGLPRKRNQSSSHKQNRVETHRIATPPGCNSFPRLAATPGISATQLSPEKLEKAPSNNAREVSSESRSFGTVGNATGAGGAVPASFCFATAIMADEPP